METIEKATFGFFHSVGFKLALIGLLTLLLLIPSGLILSLIREREQRRSETITEVTSIWGNSQTLTGPVLTIPYQSSERTAQNDFVTVTNFAHFLPENLNIVGKIVPEMRNRGIYKVVTYKTVLHVTGTFKEITTDGLDIPETALVNQDAFVEIGISDMRGINKDILLKWNDSLLSVIPGLKSTGITESGIHANAGIADKEVYHFEFDLDLNGSYALNFIPLGKETNVDIESPWTDPSFKGAFIPDNRHIDVKGFKAHWNILQLNRNFPQKWINAQYAVAESSFGVELITPVDTYQKSERSVKYAILFIGLTFLVFFFSEVMTKTRIHAVSYLLTGFALCVFYSLLTALAEHMNFNLAYLIAAVTIISMICAFAHSLYQKSKVTLTVLSSLVILYTFLFVILQLMDYSLLFGNIGLVIILAIVMFFSRKIDWYATDRSSKNNHTLAE